eukprot:7193316-Pyramimonas_sp.AAC.1
MDRKEATEDVRGAQIVPKVAQTAQGRAEGVKRSSGNTNEATITPPAALLVGIKDNNVYGRVGKTCPRHP